MYSYELNPPPLKYFAQDIIGISKLIVGQTELMRRRDQFLLNQRYSNQAREEGKWLD